MSIIQLNLDFMVDVMICTCNYSVIISLCNLCNIGLDKVIIIIRGNKSKSNYIEQNKISARLNKQHHGQLMLLLMKQSTTPRLQREIITE
jgi:hypothetical protein